VTRKLTVVFVRFVRAASLVMYDYSRDPVLARTQRLASARNDGTVDQLSRYRCRAKSLFAQGSFVRLRAWQTQLSLWLEFSTLKESREENHLRCNQKKRDWYQAKVCYVACLCCMLLYVLLFILVGHYIAQVDTLFVHYLFIH
jgi:hypothetical protein